MANCVTITESLKNLRDKGVDKDELKIVREVLNMIQNTDIQIKPTKTQSSDPTQSMGGEYKEVLSSKYINRFLAR